MFAASETLSQWWGSGLMRSARQLLEGRNEWGSPRIGHCVEDLEKSIAAFRHRLAQSGLQRLYLRVPRCMEYAVLDAQ